MRGPVKEDVRITGENRMQKMLSEDPAGATTALLDADDDQTLFI